MTAEAAKLYHAGRFDEADRAYRAALAADPDDLDTLVGAGVVAVLHNRLDEARTLLSQAIRRDPDNLRVLGELVEIAYRQDDFPTMAGLLRRIAAHLDDEARGPVEGAAANLATFTTPWRRAGPPRDVRVPFEITDPLPMVRVTLDDRTTVPFLIDTGEHAVSVDRALAQDLGLRSHSIGHGVFAGGRRAALDYGHLDTLAMGEFRMHDVPVTILDLTALGDVGGLPVRGVLGTAFLYHHLATIDYPGGALVLRPATPDRLAALEHRHAVPFWLSGTHYILARGTFNGSAPMLFFVDTGIPDGAFAAPMTTLERAGVRFGAPTTVAGGGGATTVVPFPVDELTLGPVRRRDLHGCHYADEHDEDHVQGRDFPVGGTISHQFFRPYALTFDFVGMRLFLG